MNNRCLYSRKLTLVIQKILPHYRVNFFIKLSQIIKPLIVIYGQAHGKEETKSVNSKEEVFVYNKNYYPTSSIDTFFSNIWKQIIKYKPDVVITVANLGNLNLIPLILLKKIFNYKIILWTHGWNRKKGFNTRRLIDKLRILLYRCSDALILYTEGAKTVLLNYVKKEKMFVANNTIDTFSNYKILTLLETKGRKIIKEELGFHKKYNLVYIGKITKDKLPNYLIDVFIEIKNSLDDVALHFVGSGTLQPEVESYARRRCVKDVLFHGEITDSYRAGALLYASDLLIIPGFVGLSVNHSLCFGCPVITQAEGEEGPFHSPEIEYVIEGQTGFVVRNNDIGHMKDMILSYLANEKLQLYMRKNAVEYAYNNLNINKMLMSFLDAVEYVRSKSN